VLRPTIQEKELLAVARQCEAACSEVGNDDSLYQAVARAVLETWLGQEWLERKLKSDPYFQPVPLKLPTDRFQPQYRVTRLAELLLHLQGIPGIESVLSRLKDATLSDEVAALEGAALLFRGGVPFRFVEPTGREGNDYDVEARFGLGNVCCEMKAKDDSIEPGVNTLLNTLRKARKQVPSDTPNLLFVAAANPWMLTKEGYDAFHGAREKFFRVCHRYAFIILHADDWRPAQLQNGTSGAVIFRGWAVYSNASARTQFPFGKEGLERALAPALGIWKSIDEVVCSAERRKLVRSQRLFHAHRDSSLSMCF
jgi:hypothetical protein